MFEKNCLKYQRMNNRNRITERPENIPYHQGYFSFIRQFPLFLSLFLTCLGVGLILSIYSSQATLFLAINQLHRDAADQVFMAITHLGDWPATLLLAGLFLFVNWRYSFSLISTMLYTGLFTHLLKPLLRHPRPAVYFHDRETIYTLPHYVMENSLSFPSGHTTCVFSLAITLSFLFRGQARQIAFFLLALTVAFSRVYLAQHFFKDLLAGATIGTFAGLHLLWLFDRSAWYHRPAFNSNLIKFFK